MNSNKHRHHEDASRHSTAHSVAEVELMKARHTIEQFIYSCSHTMRGPLKSITGLVYLLKRSEVRPEINSAYYLHSIEKLVEKLEGALNDLEQFLFNLSNDIAISPVDPKQMVDQVLDDFKVAILNMNIKVVVTIRQKAPLHSDSNLLRVILSHLISNAVSYQDNNKKRRKIKIIVKVNETSCVADVIDNGIGIRPEIHANIFQLFFRGTDRSVGTGVGLYVAMEIVHKLGGIISVKSEPGMGSTFSITIPNLAA